MFTSYARGGVFVAVVRGTAHWVYARVMLDRRGADEGPVSWDQFNFRDALALIHGELVAGLVEGDETDAVCCAARVSAAAVTETLEGWWGNRTG